MKGEVIIEKSKINLFVRGMMDELGVLYGNCVSHKIVDGELQIGCEDGYGMPWSSETYDYKPVSKNKEFINLYNALLCIEDYYTNPNKYHK